VNIEYIDFIDDFLDKINDWMVFKMNKKYTLKLASLDVRFKEKDDENLNKLLFDISYYPYSEKIVFKCKKTDRIYEMVYKPSIFKLDDILKQINRSQ
jgi:hypothetical protein